MKKTIGIGVVLFVLSICNLVAQDSLAIDARVSEKFSQSFPGAAKCAWADVGQWYQVTFVKDGAFCIAFLDTRGAVVTHGRKIRTVSSLPLSVQTGLQGAKQRAEKRYGALVIASVFEMLRGGETEYLVGMENNGVALMYAITSGGSYAQRSRKLQNKEPGATKNVIARKN